MYGRAPDTKTIKELDERCLKEMEVAIEKASENCRRDRSLLNWLPEDLEVVRVFRSELHGSMGSVQLIADGDIEDVKKQLQQYLHMFKPWDAEIAKDSCTWMQPAGYVDPKKEERGIEVKATPIAPIWVRGRHCTTAHTTEISFMWYTKLQNGEIMTIRVEPVNTFEWISFRYDIGHEKGCIGTYITNQQVHHRFRGAQDMIFGRGSNQYTNDITFYWHRGTELDDILDTHEKFKIRTINTYG